MAIKVYTDGSCLGNPGPGGWAVIFSLKDGLKRLSGNNTSATNNQMELQAVLEALARIWAMHEKWECKEFEIISDSAYVVNSISMGWLQTWCASGWKTKKGEPIKNKLLWKKVYWKMCLLSRDGVQIKFKKVKGHSGNTFNEMVDKIAREEANKVKGV